LSDSFLKKQEKSTYWAMDICYNPFGKNKKSITQ